MKTFTTHPRLVMSVFALFVFSVANNAHAHCKVYHPHHCTTGTIGSLPTDSIASFQDQMISNKKGRCLDVAGGRNVNGTNVQLFDCNGSRSQRWTYDAKLRRIRNNMGRCLEVAGGVFANRTNIQLFDCNGTASQKWQKTKRSYRSPGKIN